MRYSDIISKVSEETGLPPLIIKRTYMAYWKFIRDTIQELPLKENINEEEFSRLRCNFNLPSLGKLCCTLDRYKGIKKRFNYIKGIRNAKSKED